MLQTAGENILMIFINNAIYGMTGGQMAPTTLSGMKSSTHLKGEDVDTRDNPFRITELIGNTAGFILCHTTEQCILQRMP